MEVYCEDAAQGTSGSAEGSRGEARPPAKRSLGQNYLRDPEVTRRIVAALKAEPGDSLIEIGPGPGALTGHLLAGAPERLVLVEKDHAWAFARRETLREFPGVSGGVILADALELAWERARGPWKIIGNLPYNVASPLMWEIFSRAGFSRAVFMIQKEVGERIAASPGSRAYGALSVWLQSFARPQLECIVPPQAFYPRPKVYSAVLSFTPLSREGTGSLPPPPALKPVLANLIRRCFQQRRKQLGTILREARGEAGLWEKSGIDPVLRPENLSPGDFLRLALVFSQRISL